MIYSMLVSHYISQSTELYQYKNTIWVGLYGNSLILRCHFVYFFHYFLSFLLFLLFYILFINIMKYECCVSYHNGSSLQPLLTTIGVSIEVVNDIIKILVCFSLHNFLSISKFELKNYILTSVLSLLNYNDGEYHVIFPKIKK